MSSRIIRVPANGALETYRWDTIPGAAGRRVSPPPTVPTPAENAQKERAFEARVQTEREQAFRQGEAAGRQAAMQQLEAEFLRLARAIEDTSGFKSRLRAQAEGEVVDLALAIARRILRREVQTDPEAILGLVKAALERVSMREIIEIRVAPAHQSPLATHLLRIGAPEAVRLIADPALEPGAVILKTSSGLADASVQTQLEEISRGFADALGVPR